MKCTYRVFPYFAHNNLFLYVSSLTTQQRHAMFLTHFLAYPIDQLSGKFQKDISLYLLKLLTQIVSLFQDMKFYRDLSFIHLS